MAEKKYDFHRDNPSFLIYKDSEILLKNLKDEEIGRVFKAIFAFAARNETTELDGAAGTVYLVFCNNIERDGKKYEEKCRRNAENAQKAHRANASRRHRSDTDIDIGIEKEADLILDKVIVMEKIKERIDEINESSVRSVGLPLSQKLLSELIEKYGKNQLRATLVKMAYWQLTMNKPYLDPAVTLQSFLETDAKKRTAKQTSYDLDQWEEFAMNFDPTEGMQKHQPDSTDEDAPEDGE